MKKRMTQKRAWLYLAKAWSKPTHFHDYYGTRCFGAIVHKDGTLGLCTSISFLLEADLIALRTYYAMDGKIEKARSERAAYRAYVFPKDRAGAKQRAAFCRKQARLCK